MSLCSRKKYYIILEGTRSATKVTLFDRKVNFFSTIKFIKLKNSNNAVDKFIRNKLKFFRRENESRPC